MTTMPRRDFLATLSGAFTRASDRRRTDARRNILGLLGFPKVVRLGPPTVTVLDVETLAELCERNRADIADLRSRIDRGAADGRDIAVTLHEWADMKPYGTFGGR